MQIHCSEQFYHVAYCNSFREFLKLENVLFLVEAFSRNQFMDVYTQYNKIYDIQYDDNCHFFQISNAVIPEHHITGIRDVRNYYAV